MAAPVRTAHGAHDAHDGHDAHTDHGCHDPAHANCDHGRELVTAAAAAVRVHRWTAALGTASLACFGAAAASAALQAVAAASGPTQQAAAPIVDGALVAGGVDRLGSASAWLAALGALLAFVVFLVGNTMVKTAAVAANGSQQQKPSEATQTMTEHFLAQQHYLATRLSGAVRIPTVSYDSFVEWDKAPESPEEADRRAVFRGRILELHAYLRDQYRRAFSELEVTVVNELSLVLRWKAKKGAGGAAGAAGAGAGKDLRPVAFAAHMDVVPCPNAARWHEEPFSGAIKDGYVHGRGSIDDKQAVLGLLEAVEANLEAGFSPSRDIYLLFGHDEEIGGNHGAHHIAAHLLANKVQLEFLLDEGLFVMCDVVPGHAAPVAMVCPAEKGSVTVELTLQGTPGHSSTPEFETPIGIMSAAVSRLERNPLPAYFGGGIEEQLFQAVSPGLPLPLRVLVHNSWLFGGLLKKVLASKPKTSTLVRTTTALTVFKSGDKSNVVPGEARALVNHRIHPKDTVESVVAYDRRIVNDPRIKFKVLESRPPAPVSSTTSAAFGRIKRCVKAVYPEAVVAPGIMVANTDTRHYWTVAENIYRFCPTFMRNKEDLAMFHGLNEKISTENYARIAAFYAGLMQDSTS